MGAVKISSKPNKPASPAPKKNNTNDNKNNNNPPKKAQQANPSTSKKTTEADDLIDKLGMIPKNSSSSSSEAAIGNKWSDQPNTGAQDAAIRTGGSSSVSGSKFSPAINLAANAALSSVGTNLFGNAEQSPAEPTLGTLAMDMVAANPLSAILSAISVVPFIYRNLKTPGTVLSRIGGLRGIGAGGLIAADTLNPVQNIAQGLSHTTPGNKLINWGRPENIIAAGVDKLGGLMSDIADNNAEMKSSGDKNYLNWFKPGAAQENWNQRVKWSEERQKIIDKNASILQAKRLQDTMYSSPSYVAKLKEAGQDVKSSDFIGPPTPYENLMTTDEDIAAIPDRKTPKIFENGMNPKIIQPYSEKEKRDAAIELNRKKLNVQPSWTGDSRNRANMPIDSVDTVMSPEEYKKFKNGLQEVPPELPTEGGMKDDGVTPWFSTEVSKPKKDKESISGVLNNEYMADFAASFVSENLAEILLKSYEKKFNKALIRKKDLSGTTPEDPKIEQEHIAPEDGNHEQRSMMYSRPIGVTEEGNMIVAPNTDWRPSLYRYTKPKLDYFTLPVHPTEYRNSSAKPSEKVKVIKESNSGFGTIYPRRENAPSDEALNVGHSPETPSPYDHVFEGEPDVEKWMELPKSTKLYDSSDPEASIPGNLRYLSGKTSSGAPIWTERSISNIVDEHKRKTWTDGIPDLTIGDLEESTLEPESIRVARFGRQIKGTKKPEFVPEPIPFTPEQEIELARWRREKKSSAKQKRDAKPSGFPERLLGNNGFYFLSGPEKKPSSGRMVGSKRKMYPKGDDPDRTGITRLLDQNGIVRVMTTPSASASPILPRENLENSIEMITATNNPVDLQNWLASVNVTDTNFSPEDELKLIIYEESISGQHNTKEKLLSKIKSRIAQLGDPQKQKVMSDLLDIQSGNQASQNASNTGKSNDFALLSEEEKKAKIAELENLYNDVRSNGGDLNYLNTIRSLINQLETANPEFSDINMDEFVQPGGSNKYQQMIDKLFLPSRSNPFTSSAIIPLLKEPYISNLKSVINQQKHTLGGINVTNSALWNDKRDSLLFSGDRTSFDQDFDKSELNSYLENYESIFPSASNNQSIFDSNDKKITYVDSRTGEISSDKPQEIKDLENKLQKFWSNIFLTSTIRPDTFLSTQWLDNKSKSNFQNIKNDFENIVNQIERSNPDNNLVKYLNAIKNRGFKGDFFDMCSRYSSIMAVKTIELQLNQTIDQQARKEYQDQQAAFSKLPAELQLIEQPFVSGASRLTNNSASNTGLQEYAILLAKSKLNQLNQLPNTRSMPLSQTLVPQAKVAQTAPDFWSHLIFLVNRISNLDSTLKWSKYLPSEATFSDQTSMSQPFDMSTLVKFIAEANDLDNIEQLNPDELSEQAKSRAKKIFDQAKLRVSHSKRIDAHLAAVLSELAENLRKRNGIGYIDRSSWSQNPSKRDTNLLKYRMLAFPQKSMKTTADMIDPQTNPSIIQEIRLMFYPNIDIDRSDYSIDYNPNSGFKDMWLPHKPQVIPSQLPTQTTPSPVMPNSDKYSTADLDDLDI